jgi:hypothetical protein
MASHRDEGHTYEQNFRFQTRRSPRTPPTRVLRLAPVRAGQQERRRSPALHRASRPRSPVVPKDHRPNEILDPRSYAIMAVSCLDPKRRSKKIDDRFVLPNRPSGFVSSGFSNHVWSTFVFQILDLINVGFSGLIRTSGFNYSLPIGACGPTFSLSQDIPNFERGICDRCLHRVWPYSRSGNQGEADALIR